MTVPAFIASARVRQLLRYWQDKRGDAELPRRDDIDPGEFKALVPYVAIVELFEAPLRARFRLAGAKYCEVYKRNLTGLWLHEVEVVGDHQFWLDLYGRLKRERRPIFGRTEGTIDDAVVFSGQGVALPLSTDGAGVDRVLELEEWNSTRDMTASERSRIVWTTEIA